jgi:hypothetical protein
MISSYGFSQNEIADLYVGDVIDIENVSIEFVELISDSRCPKNVNCIRAGEAEVLVAVYRNGTFSHEKVLTFYANGMVKKDNMQLFASDELLVEGLLLHPYPKGLTKIRDEDYMLSVGIN